MPSPLSRASSPSPFCSSASPARRLSDALGHGGLCRRLFPAVRLFLRLQHDAAVEPKWLLRRFDHASIYLMIAGTYTALSVAAPRRRAGLGAGGFRLGGRARRRGPQDPAARKIRPRLSRRLSGARLDRRLRGPPAGRNPAGSDAGPHPGRRPVLFGRRPVLPLAQPEIPERHLAFLRRNRGGLPICRHSRGPRPRRLGC